MSIHRTGRASAALIGLALLSAATSARADISDYEFQLVEQEIAKGKGAIVTVKLLHNPTGKAVADAVLFEQRIDMEPDGMATMTSPLELLQGSEPGIYRFQTDLPMAGGWRLSLAAKIQGETGTLESRLVLKAVP
ncbi:MAG: FixH family protein [Rhizobiales bacterium]|nr:FixH family protein [Hyphomicrobiales bacterium]MDQ3561046.1 FixH family protein [Pseudomonadota bacterium]